MLVTTLTTYLSPAVLGLGVMVGWLIALRAQVRERTLDARDRISSIAEIFLLDGDRELLSSISQDMCYQPPWYVSLKKPKWYVTVIAASNREPKADVSFSSSNYIDPYMAVSDVLASISTKIPYDTKFHLRPESSQGEINDLVYEFDLTGNTRVIVFLRPRGYNISKLFSRGRSKS